jgi:DNA-binding NarL/FixJ family response regulator
MRAGLRALLERHGQFSVVCEAASESEALQGCPIESPDLALIDFSVPHLNGLAAIARIRREHPRIRVVILLADDREDVVIEAFISGASAFVLKSVSGTNLLEVMDTVSKGGSFLTVELYQQLLQRVQTGKSKLDGRNPNLGGLSPRELEVLRLVVSGQRTKEAAVTMGLSFETTRSYRKTMMKKLGVTNVAVLTAFAIANGILDTESYLGTSGLSAA